MSARKPTVLVTVDTESDDEWTWRAEPSTTNGQGIDRFQAICDRWEYPPTYLVTYDMLEDPHVAERLGAIARDGRAEIGAHLHTWRTPPYDEKYDRSLAYPHELPEPLLGQKLEVLTRHIEEKTGIKPRSYRAGRYGFDARTLGHLERLGYSVDSSVTPHISWQPYPGVPGGPGGPDFFDFPEEPYYLDRQRIERHGDSPVLEVPLSVRVSGMVPAARGILRRKATSLPLRVARKLGVVQRREMRPCFVPLDDLKALARTLTQESASMINLLIHSSEWWPGCSPYHPDEASVEAFLERLDSLLAYCAQDLGLAGASLATFGDVHATGRRPAGEDE